MRKILLVLSICLLFSLPVPSSVSAHVIPTVTHTITLTPGSKKSDVDITYYYDPVVINRFIPDFDPDRSGSVDDSEKKKWSDAHLKNIIFSINDKNLTLEDEKLTIPEIDGLMNAGDPLEITGTLTFPLSCNESTKVHIVDTNAFMSLQDDIYTFVINKKGCISVSTLKSPNNEAIVYIGKALTDKEKETGNVAAPTSSKPKATVTTATQISEVTKILRGKELGTSLLLWAFAISFVLGGLHALTPGHGKTLVAAYLVGQHGTKKDALLLATVTTLTHTSSIYILGLISLFATQYFLPEKIIPALEVVSALSIFGLGVWLLSRRWEELKQSKAPHEHDDQHEHEHDHNHDHTHDHPHSHGAGKGQHVHALYELKGSKIGLKSLISLGFSGGIVPCADALAIMIIAIGINKTVLGMILIFFFSLGLAAVLVSLGLVMVTSRKLFDRYAPSTKVAKYFPVMSALIIICIGAVLVLKAVKII